MIKFGFLWLTILTYTSLSFALIYQNSVIRKSYSKKINLHASETIYLHGSPQSRSPLVNWYLYENNIPFIQRPARPSNHPFGQIPFLTNDAGFEVFESGAILLYLADAYGGYQSPQERAGYTKWVVWANSELDYLCFGKGMSGTKLDKGKNLNMSIY